ncbi:MAG: filamentous hemagglutinin N-terminal domain-containing protein [Alphaproteobacteria bacterium]|nr:filamentous hemagglutinin N-terminal domain-containing protein [Alphaproteobacteria bacterium]
MADNNNKVAAQSGTRDVSHKNWLMATASRFVPVAARFAMAGLIAVSFSGIAHAGSITPNTTPQGANVVAGSATVSYPNSNSMTVNQHSNRTVIDWTSFNIGANATAEFKQPKSTSIAVNRVVGPGMDPTQILGKLKANGQVVVLDPNGVFFGAGSRVDAAGLVASTGHINVQDFMGGAPFALTGMTSGTVQNMGTITAKSGGLVALVAPHVINSGIIQARLGRVELASGSAVTLDLYGDGMVSLAASEGLGSALVKNSGSIYADGGHIVMTADAAEGVVDEVINMSGYLQAQSYFSKEGSIYLRGNSDGAVNVTGAIEARGTSFFSGKGGYVEVTGDEVTLDGASVDVSGVFGGGTAYIGGGVFGKLDGIEKPSDHTIVSADSSIEADATWYGNGGTVVVWGNEHSEFYGDIKARGGQLGGDGGFVEVSTGIGVVYEGMVDTSAPKGKRGMLLIDPASVLIGNAAPTPDGSYVNAMNLAETMFTSNVTIIADNNVDVVEDVDLSTSPLFGLSTFGSLALNAPILNIDGDVTMGSGNVSLQGDTLNLNARFLDSTGNDLDGTRLSGAATVANVLSPNASIQQAIDGSSMAVTPTVNVASGQYHGNYTIGKSVTVRGNGGDLAVEGPDATAPELFGVTPGAAIFNIANQADVTIEGFNMQAAVEGGTVADSSTGVSATSTNNLTVTNNNFDGFDVAAVDIQGGDNVTVTYNTISDQGNSGISISGATNVTEHNNVVTDGSDNPGGGDNGGGDNGGGDNGGGDNGGGDNGDDDKDDDGKDGHGWGKDKAKKWRYIKHRLAKAVKRIAKAKHAKYKKYKQSRKHHWGKR